MPGEAGKPLGLSERLQPLAALLAQIEAVSIISGNYEDGWWWIKFRIDPINVHAWKTVQFLAFVINSLNRRNPEPVIFAPYAFDPFLEGTPESNLDWAIENIDERYTPDRAIQHIRFYLDESYGATGDG